VPSTWASIGAARPDVVIVAPCGFHLAGAADQARTVADALPECEVWAIDADGLVVRPGPRLTDGVEAIASILHPDAVPPMPGRVALVKPGPAGQRADPG
jgi:iron complex transport system substrate-binding protein